MISSVSFGRQTRTDSFSCHKVLTDEGESTASHFFNEIKTAFLSEPITQHVAFIVVSHVVADLPVFLHALMRLGRVSAVIFKGSYDYKNNVMYSEIQQRIRQLSKKNISEVDGKEILEELEINPRHIYRFIEKHVEPHESFILLDIGGYFAHSLHLLEEKEELKDRFLGVVEDTENGHKRYESYSTLSRVYSVARSEQKKTEDYNVGKSIVHAVGNMLRDQGRKIEEFGDVGVVGFGKIGKSISHHLRGMHVARLYVHDNNPNIAMQIASSDFQISTREELLNKCTLIFSATGKNAIASEDFSKICKSERKDVFVASVTSAKDEFDLRNIDRLKSAPITSNSKRLGITYFEPGTPTKVHLLANGNAANFFYGNNVVGEEYIRAVQAAILVASILLIKTPPERAKKIHEITSDQEKTISRIWLRVFARKELGTLHNLIADNQNHFIGRDSFLTNLNGLFSRGGFSTFFLHGGSGVGKSELALRYAHTHKDEYDIVWQISEKEKHHDLKKLYEKLNVSARYADFHMMVDRLAEQLSQKNYLLIVDNVLAPGREGLDSEMAKLMEELRKKEQNNKKQHILCISQPKIKPDSTELDKLTSEETQNFFKSHLSCQSNDETIATLQMLVDNNIPMVLRLTIKTLKVSNLSLEEFIKWLRSNDASQTQLLNLLIHLSLKIINQFKVENSDVFSNVLYVLIHLNYDRINSKILQTIGEEINIAEEDVEFILKKLVKHGLLESRIASDGSETTYFMHQLIRGALCETMHKETPDYIRKCREISLKVAINLFNYNFNDSQSYNYSEVNFYKNHAIWAIHHTDNQFTYPIAKLALKLGSFFLNEERDYVESIKFYEIAIQALQQLHPKKRANLPARMLEALHGKLVNMTELYRKFDKYCLPELESLAQQVKGAALKVNSDKWILMQVPIALSYVFRCVADHKTELTDKMTYLKEAETQLRLVSDSVVSSSSKRRNTSNIVGLGFHAKGSLHICFAELKEGNEKLEDLFKAIESFKKAIDHWNGLNATQPTIARSYFHLGHVHLILYTINKSMESLAAAQYYFHNAEEFQLKIFKDEHFDLKKTKDALKKLDQDVQHLTDEQSINYQAQYKKLKEAEKNIKTRVQPAQIKVDPTRISTPLTSEDDESSSDVSRVKRKLTLNDSNLESSASAQKLSRTG